MDPISASCYSLHVEDGGLKKDGIRKQDELFVEMIVSNASLSRFEARNIKTLIPQIIATAISASFHLVVGLALAYSAILIPQLEGGTTDLTASKEETTWIASVIVIAVPIGAIFGGFIMDAKGRLNTIRFSTIPVLIGWSMIALANSVTMILVGRILTGLGSAWFSSPAVVYITEIARPDIRGSLISSAPAFASLGMVLAYLKGWFFSWRTTAWLANVYVIISAIFVMFIPESPAWLVSKGRIDEARRSLEWINRYQPAVQDEKQKSLSEMQLALLIKEKKITDDENAQSTASSAGRTLRALFKPTGIKPIVILAGLFFFQDFSGVYVTLFYSVTFFVEMGATVNPYLASVLIGLVRFIMSMVNTYLLKRFKRRPLVMVSCAGMAVCMFVCGLFSYWIEEGTSSQSWVPVLFLLLYVVTSMIGMLPIPWTMTAELFPLEIRGIGHSISYSMANLLMFASLQAYRPLNTVLGGAYGILWFFAGISVLGIVYTFIFLPETHGMKLSDIQTYFENNIMYLGQKKVQPKVSNVAKNTRLETKDVKVEPELRKQLIEGNMAAA